MHSSASLARTRSVLADVTPPAGFMWTARSLLLHLKAISLELLAEGFELAAARGICVALTAGQFGLGREFWLRIRRRRAKKGGSRAQQRCGANPYRNAA
jgi:hypothetical protein